VSYIVEDVFADTSTSTNFVFEESSIGTGGLIESSSTSYKVTEAIGNNVAGDWESTNFTSSAGSKTTNDPSLSLLITDTTGGFTDFSSSSTAYATSTFSVLNYTSWGYVVQITGNPPSNQSHTLPAMASTAAPTTGQEEFGINLVANTTPNVGANPVQGYFGFGTAAANYATANQYRYVSGETIVSAPKSSGFTHYTISYIANVESVTPGGTYSSYQTLVCTGTY
jgi:hypothetical protein